MRILVIGSGAREHALVRSLMDGGGPEGNDVVICAPGNAGIAAEVETRPVDVADPTAIADLAVDVSADLVVIGPEVPLVAGAADAVRARDIACFGPSSEAALLEGSKAFAKRIMAEAGVPTAMSFVCTTLDEVSRALDEFGAPYVVKDDGLAAGKGVVVTDDRQVALNHAAACLDREGEAAVVIEEFLDGPEVSLFAITDGVTVVPLQPAQDYKRAYDGDAGPNTGGMGAYSPLTWAPDGLVDEVVERVLQPTIDVMRHRDTPFSGLLYAGLALTSRGLRVVEFNARFGDPETQVVLARLASPLRPLLHAAATGGLDLVPEPRWHDGGAVVVVVAAEGYPEAPVLGDPITGTDEAEAESGVQVLHAGTRSQDGAAVASGGRVLSVVGTGDDVPAARAAAYRGVARIGLRGSHHRGDIAADR